ncbi:MAG: formylglycine-generating enzyme family protein [Myxococcota bacterium]|nr:formylglycine-generating enzyme family protein [Myxococcota bacterium]
MIPSNDSSGATTLRVFLAAAGFAAAGAAFFVANEVEAKAGECEYGTNCPVPEEDGCCPAPKGKVAREFLEQLRKSGKAKGESSKRKKSGDCPEGQTFSLGHCCWFGQTWDKEEGVCGGQAEACPQGYEAVGRGCRKPLAWVASAPTRVEFMRSEVTVAQYNECLMAGGCHPGFHFGKDDNKHCNFGQKNRNDHPMNCVAYGGAAQYCAWIGGRLPTEDLWTAEASNAGTRPYPWGIEPEPGANNTVFKEASTLPVCSKPEGHSISGVCDLSGNVWEWTASTSKEGDAWMVIRGGSWLSTTAESLTVNYRSGQDPNTAWVTTGLRCVR